MKKIVLHFEDGHTMNVSENIEKMNLVENFENFYEKLNILKLNDFEYKLFGVADEYQILNIQTKELYSNTNQNGVIKVRLILEEEEFERILEKVKNKINDNNN